MKLRFDCVFYFVTDMERAISFYTEVLGLKLMSRDAVARFDIDGVLFELAPSPSETATRGNGNARLCLRVDSIRDCRAELTGRGVPCGASHEVAGGRFAMFQDPDGNEICLWESDRAERSATSGE